MRTEVIQEFLVFARHLNFSKAAAELHITQPALSRNMKKLETTLGVSLFNRESSRITLNETGKIAAEYLLSLGHRDIAYVGYRKTGLAQVHRFHGFLQVCREHGIEPYVLENADSRSSIEAGYRLGVELLEKGPKVTAAFAATDYTALGVLKACNEHGIAVPDDLSLMGFDNTLVSSLPRIELTTVDQKKDVMAKAAVDTLIDMINADGSAQYGRHVILPSLIERNTCRPLER